jgi:multidrug efflux system membrane fusion protein
MTCARIHFAVLGFAIVLGACSKPGEPAPQTSMPPAPEVGVVSVQSKALALATEFASRIEPVESAEIRPRISGPIERVGFSAGANVRKGDLLFVIDAKPFAAELARTEANLMAARNRLELARTEFARFEKLVADQTVTQQEFDQKRSALRDAESAVASNRAQVEAARLNLDYTQVRAPISGRIGRAEVTTGNLVSAGQTRLTSIVAQQPVYASFEIDEAVFTRYAKALRSGAMAAELVATVPNGTIAKGKIDFVDNRFDPASGTMRVRATFANTDGSLTPGLLSKVRLAGEPVEVLLVPDKAVGTDQSNKFVVVVGDKGVTDFRPVVLGPLVDGGLRVVQSGLKAGEQIIVEGLQRVRPGMPVAPKALQ